MDPHHDLHTRLNKLVVVPFERVVAVVFEEEVTARLFDDNERSGHLLVVYEHTVRTVVLDDLFDRRKLRKGFGKV